MHRLWEHVYRADAFKLIAVLTEIFQISGQGGRITGYIYYALRSYAYHSAQTVFVTALSRRIDYYKIDIFMCF